MSVESEYHKIESVIVHEPGYEWNLVTVTENMPEKFLVEDVLFTEHAAADHRQFTDCLRHVSGESAVLEFVTLLEEILSNSEVRSDVVGSGTFSREIKPRNRPPWLSVFTRTSSDTVRPNSSRTGLVF